MFKFGFEEQEPEPEVHAGQNTAPALKHTLELIKQDCPRISYTHFNLNGVSIPRRDIFDVRYQLMAMDKLDDQMKLLLGEEDVRKNVYEGGLKVWEGALDLIECLKKYDGEKVLELGCGAAIPSCYLLYNAFKQHKKARIVVADYNEAILRFLTVPNCVLAWLAATVSDLPERGEVNLTSELIDQFSQALTSSGIELEFISGGWSPSFSQLVGDDSFDLVLASETIYSLESLGPFVDVVKRALAPSGCALVAAKKVYFGVGGSVVEFEKKLEKQQLKYTRVLQTGDVGRVVIEVMH